MQEPVHEIENNFGNIDQNWCVLDISGFLKINTKLDHADI